MRVFPPSTIGLQRVTPPGGITIGDRTFRAGTVLSVHLPSMLLSEQLWGPDAREFVPERWLGDEKKTTALDKYFIPVSLILLSTPFHPGRIRGNDTAARADCGRCDV